MVALVLRLVVSLAVVLGLFWMVARTGSRKLGGRDRALLRVRGRQSLTRSASLAVVEVGSRVLVVGVSDGGVRLLTEMDPRELAAVAEPAPVRPRRLPRPLTARTSTPGGAAVPAAASTGEPARKTTREPVAGSTSGPSGEVADVLVALDARMAAHAEQPPAEQPAYATYQQHYDEVYEGLDRIHPPPEPSQVPERTAGPLAGSLLSVSTWRAAWATAVGRGERPLDEDAA